MNHENTKSKKHETFRKVFVFSFFRDFVMAVFDSTLDVDYWIFETNKVTTFDQDLTDFRSSPSFFRSLSSGLCPL